MRPQTNDITVRCHVVVNMKGRAIKAELSVNYFVTKLDSKALSY